MDGSGREPTVAELKRQLAELRQALRSRTEEAGLLRLQLDALSTTERHEDSQLIPAESTAMLSDDDATDGWEESETTRRCSDWPATTSPSQSWACASRRWPASLRPALQPPGRRCVTWGA